MQPKTIRTARRVAAVLAAAALLLTCTPTASAGQTAASINASCTFASSSNSTTFSNATDGDYTTKWISASGSSQTIDITIGAGSQIGGIYFIWSKAPVSWTIYAVDSGGAMTAILEGGTDRYLTQYVYIPAEYAAYRRFRLLMTCASATVDIAELTVFGPGEGPYYAPIWEPLSGRVDLLTIAAHPDDEDLYLSVPAVTYADQGMRCATVFMTYGSASSSVRRYEAQESVWCLHNKGYPTMGNFQDIKTSTKELQMEYWPLEDVIGYIVEQIRKYKPSVIVTHDVNGEYGHGAHMLTEYATTLAFQYAGDASRYPASAQQYGTWNAGKLYVHLYGTNALNTMSLTTVLPSFGGRTVLQAVSDAYNRHDSQLPGRELPTSGDYDMRKFGLFASNLGADAAHDTMFEHVTEEAMLQLNPWYIYETVDRSALTQTLNEANAKVEAHYTPESWAAAGLPSAIVAAQAVMDDHEAMQPQVDEQTNLLNDALGKLVTYLVLLRMDSPPDKLDYIVGETLDLLGLTVTAIYSDGAERSLAAADVAASGFDSTSPIVGQTVTITYADAHSSQSASFLVDILSSGGELIESVIYNIDRGSSVVSNISPGITAEQLIAGFSNTPEKLQLFEQNGSAYAGGAIASGMVVKLVVEGVVTDTLRLSVLGDVNGDGEIDIDDILYIRADIVDTYTLKVWQSPAADVSGDGVIDINDILYVRAHILGTYTIAAKEA